MQIELYDAHDLRPRYDAHVDRVYGASISQAVCSLDPVYDRIAYNDWVCGFLDEHPRARYADDVRRGVNYWVCALCGAEFDDQDEANECCYL